MLVVEKDRDDTPMHVDAVPSSWRPTVSANILSSWVSRLENDVEARTAQARDAHHVTDALIQGMLDRDAPLTPTSKAERRLRSLFIGFIVFLATHDDDEQRCTSSDTPR